MKWDLSVVFSGMQVYLKGRPLENGWKPNRNPLAKISQTYR